MDSVIYVFGVIANIVKEVINGFIEFFNTIPILFKNISNWSSQLFPQDFSQYIVILIPIIITLLIIKFVRG